MLDVLTDTLLDVVRLIPFLFLAYLAMECLEHKAGDGTRKLIRWAGGRGRIHAGPVIGGLLGAVPQCGFSAAASNLYAGRVTSLGTLIAVYLSTSDEMLPILISERAPVKTILVILLSKALIGTAAGMVIDCAVRRRGREREGGIHDICEKEHCHCEQGIVRSALSHTVRIAFFILLVTLVLNLALHFAGEDALAGMLLNRPVLGPMLAGLVGLIPNCGGSVAITQLYLEGAMGMGSALAGLLAGSGVGLLVLFRANRDKRENLMILGLLYGIGVAVGIVAELLW